MSIEEIESLREQITALAVQVAIVTERSQNMERRVNVISGQFWALIIFQLTTLVAIITMLVK